MKKYLAGLALVTMCWLTIKTVVPVQPSHSALSDSETHSLIEEVLTKEKHETPQGLAPLIHEKNSTDPSNTTLTNASIHATQSKPVEGTTTHYFSEKDKILSLARMGTYYTPEESERGQQNFKNRVHELGLMENEKSWSVHMEKSFSREEIDARWAYEYETSLYETFTSDPKLARYSINEIKCRTERCKVEVAMTNPDDMIEATMALTKNLVLQRNGLNYAKYLSYYSVDTGVATWYIGKDKYVDLLGKE